jgi:uncharacterized protein (DUF4415 family)
MAQRNKSARRSAKEPETVFVFVRLPKDLRDALRERGWRQRTTMSHVLRDLIRRGCSEELKAPHA